MPTRRAVPARGSADNFERKDGQMTKIIIAAIMLFGLAPIAKGQPMPDGRAYLEDCFGSGTHQDEMKHGFCVGFLLGVMESYTHVIRKPGNNFFDQFDFSERFACMEGVAFNEIERALNGFAKNAPHVPPEPDNAIMEALIRAFPCAGE